MLLHRVLDQLIDAYFPVLSRLDDELDELEDDILRKPTDEQLGRLFDMKRGLITLRKVVTPQRDMLASLLSNPDEIPGMTRDAERYFRDLYDHLIRISDLVDNHRDLMSSALDTHLSTVSNRLNVVMKQLTIMASVFLPMTFFTGFFGQNFGWMVDRIGSYPVFLGAGIGLQVLVAGALLIFFQRRGWLSSSTAAPQGGPVKRHPHPASAWALLHSRGRPNRP
jgi:magnesium transporter